MKTIGEVIKHAEYIVNNRKDAISVCWSVKDCQQLAAWLRELVERRKAPEIITGEWELKDHQWECDKCGCRINVKNPLDCDKWNYYYCPHCGTKMLIAVQRGR